MFSTRENAEFFNPYQSPDTLVRQQPVGRKVVQRHECQIVGRGHKNFYLPALRAANEVDGWRPITVIAHDGTRLIFETTDGAFVVYNHDADALGEVVEFHRGYRMMRGPEVRGDDGYVRRSSLWVSFEPMGPCLAEEI